MTFDQLTPEQQAQLQAFMDAFRPMMGETARLFGKLQRLEDAWNGPGGVGAVVALLDDAAPVGTTGLTGAGSLTKANITGTMTDFGYALGAFNSDTNRQAYVRAAGITNAIG